MRVMFIWEGEPLHDAVIRLTHDQSTTEYVTDQDGQVTTDLIASDVHVSALVDPENDTWQEQTVSLAGKKSLVVVDLTIKLTDTIAASPPGSSSGVSGLTLDNVLVGSNQSLGERYVFETILGRGGMGVVVKARDELLNRHVAIKMLNEEFSENEEAQGIFLTEARAIATLQHPNLVGIYDVTMIEGRAMIVFEYVEGKNLDRVLGDSGRLSEAALLRVGIQMSRALRYLHEQGFIHRDIKPANVLLQEDGLLRVIDFGLARSLEQLQIRGTQVRGTPAYMAPEQIEGTELLEATDVYQLGVTLYELASGRLPFETGNIGYSHLFKDPPLLTEVIPDINERLAKLIHSCLAKEPAGRPTTNELFFSLQEAYLAGAQEYEQDTTILQPNDQLLFASTSEIDVNQLRRSRSSRQDHDPGLADLGTATAEVPSITAPSSSTPEDESDSKMAIMLTAFGLVGAIVAAIGIIAVMSMPEKGEKKDPTPEAVVATSEQEAAPEDDTPEASDASPRIEVGAANPKPAEERVDPNPVEDPEANQTAPLVADVKPDNSNADDEPPQQEKAEKAARNMPKVKAESDKKAKEKITASKDGEDTSGGGEDNNPPGEEIVLNNGSEDTEGGANATTDDPPGETTDKTVASTAPAEKDGDKEAKDDEEESKTTRKVIRKKIIRKKVIRKKPEDSKPESAPTSF